jgi:hypothetical protein
LKSWRRGREGEVMSIPWRRIPLLVLDVHLTTYSALVRWTGEGKRDGERR